jgi:nucleoside-diphosphate-sugar epimerase
MRILITGNMGYVGPSVVRLLRKTYPDAKLIGYDMGYFAGILTSNNPLPEYLLDMQYFGDVRTFPSELLEETDAVVYLAALSNDPMGNRFSQITHNVNCLSAIRIAAESKKYGVKRFVFASSCSIYGYAEDGERTESSPVNPLTAYATSKVDAENGLRALADDIFIITCPRFATACGMSDRLRLDLVLNDFVASAVSCGRIDILSDGTPWRPLIHVEDMARGIEWGISRDLSKGGNFLLLNVGATSWNYQVKDLAANVAEVIPGVEIKINADAQPDRRSYRVSFELFSKLAPDHLPLWDLQRTILDLKQGLDEMQFADTDFRNSRLMRLKALDSLMQHGEIDDALSWTTKGRRSSQEKCRL